MKYKPPGHCNSIGFETPGKHLTKFLHDLGSGKNPGPLLSQIVFVFVLADVVGFAIVVVVIVVAGVVVVVVDALAVAGSGGGAGNGRPGTGLEGLQRGCRGRGEKG